MFKKVSLIILNRCWQLLAVVVILFAVLVTIARFMIPTINDYRVPIENFISEKSGVQISIGKITGSWESIGPVLEISNVHFGDSTSPDPEGTSSINLIKISISTLPTIFYQTLITDQLIIEGMSLKIQQLQSTEFILPNFTRKTSDVTSINPNLVSNIQDWLQNQSNIILYNTHLDISIRDGAHYPVDVDEIYFEKGKDIYQLTGMSKLPGNNQIDFTLEVDGFLTDPKTEGHLYIHTHEINMAELPMGAIWEETEILSGLLELQLWADWKNSQFESALIAIKIADYLMSLQGEPQTNLQKLDSYLVWQKQVNGWVFESQQTEIISRNRAWPDPSISIKMQQLDQQKQYTISATRLDLGIWTDLILANPNLDSTLRKQLLTMNPHGFLQDTRLYASFEDKVLIDLRANARFSEFSWNSWNNIPGINNLAGQFEIHEDRGIMLLDSRNLTFDYPSMFRWPFEIENITSRFSWQIADDLLSLNLNNLTIDLADAQLLADGHFEIQSSSGSVDMNVYAELAKGNVAQTKLFLPTGIMSDRLVDYLDQSIKSGSLTSAQIAIRGSASNFPFENPEGVFAINAQIRDTKFVFGADWPEIKDITADLWFVENGMEIAVTEGNSQGQTVSKASIIINDFSAEPALLLVNSSSKGMVEQGIGYLNNSPLKNSIGSIFEIIPTTGPFELELDLVIPLEGEQQIIVDGEVKLQKNSLLIKPVDMSVNNIQGKIKITDSLISTSKITAELMGGKSHFLLQQEIDDKGFVLTTLQSEGDVTTAGIRKVFPDWIPALVQGQTNYQAKLLLPEVDQETDVIMDLKVDSTLQGISSQFPAPFSKNSEQSEVFILNYKIHKNDQQLFSISLSELVDLKLDLSNQTGTRGQISFGGNKAIIPEQDGIRFTGNFEYFDLEPWLDLIVDKSNSVDTVFEAENYSDLYIENLLIKQLHYYFMDFNEVNISATVENNSFLFNLSSEQISGQITIPDASESLPIDINLSSLSIADQFPDIDKTGQLSEPVSDDFPTKFINKHLQPLPPINIYCKECIYNNQVLGTTSINITPLVNGNAFKLKMDHADILGLDLIGEWTSNLNSEVSTKLSGSINTHKLGALLPIFNLSTGIHDTKFNASGELSWQGDPLQFNYRTLNGALSIKGGKGNQEDVSDRGARIFSLFSVGSLARKLTLDFSDLFGDGFFYNSMKGTFKINTGIFNTSDFEIDGTSADVEIVGISDVPNNKIEQCILVTPDLSASLPVLAGWAIEPVTGLVVYLMSKLFQPVLKVVTSIQYKVTGAFDKPIITEIGKTEGTATIEHLGEKETTIIIPAPKQTIFSCDGVFNK